MLTKDSANSNSITSDAIYLSMRDRIVSGEWGPGKRLVQRTLAKEFGSSAIPVLESIRRLESDQLVTSHPNAGAQVRSWTESDIESVYSARGALEGVTCRLFAIQASKFEKERVVELALNFDRYYVQGLYNESSKADERLHLYILNRSVAAENRDALSVLAQNAFLLSVTIRSITVKKLAEMGEKIPFGGGPAGSHDPLIKAFEACDGEAAERAIHLHVEEAKKTLLKSVELIGGL